MFFQLMFEDYHRTEDDLYVYYSHVRYKLRRPMSWRMFTVFAVALSTIIPVDSLRFDGMQIALECDTYSVVFFCNICTAHLSCCQLHQLLVLKVYYLALKLNVCYVAESCCRRRTVADRFQTEPPENICDAWMDIDQNLYFLYFSHARDYLRYTRICALCEQSLICCILSRVLSLHLLESNKTERLINSYILFAQRLLFIADMC